MIAPETVLRSSFCAEGVLGGARLFLLEAEGGFVVATRWQVLGRRRRLQDAIALFERRLLGR